jgi:hypothetical protein
LNSNTNSNNNSEALTVEPTPSPQAETITRETNPATKQAPQVDIRKTATKANTTPVATKPTPKKSDRTVILQ